MARAYQVARAIAIAKSGRRVRSYFCIMSWTNSLSVTVVLVDSAARASSMDGLTVDTTVAILVSLANHLIDLVICKLLANRGHDVTKLGRRNETIVVTVKHLMRVSRHRERV
jgi:hypothetical protein